SAVSVLGLFGGQTGRRSRQRRQFRVVVAPRRTLILRQRMLVELLHGNRHGALELWIMTLAHELRVLPHGHIGAHSVILHRECAVETLYRNARSRNAAAIHQLRIATDANEPAPGALAHQRADVVHLEVPRQRIAARAGELIDDHDLGPENRLRRHHRHATPAGHVDAHGPLLQLLDDIVRDQAAVVVALIDDDALLVDLGEEVAVEIGEAAPGGVGQVDIAELAAAEASHGACVTLYPRRIAQLPLARYGFDGHLV